MQQECLLNSIMTSRRRSQTALRTARFALAAFASSMLGACAALPDDASVVEKLESETGVTITRLGHPIELYRETFLKDPAGRFAFLGPFETNQMGQRDLFLWIAVPIEPVADSVPVVEIDGAGVTLGTPGRTAEFAGINKSPYKIPTPWSAMYYFKVDADLISRLGESTKLTVRMLEAANAGTVKTVFETEVVADTRLKDFASH
jgi:hypothetical protein